MNEFFTDDKWQRQQRDEILVPQFYRRHFWMRYELMDNKMEFQARGIDTVVFGKGDPVYVEEKIVRWPGYKYTAFTLETKSCTIPGYEKSGWMVYGEADRLLYCFDTPNGLGCWWIDFPALQKWFWPRESSFPLFQMKDRNKTAGRVVDIDEVQRSVATDSFQLKCSQA